MSTNLAFEEGEWWEAEVVLIMPMLLSVWKISLVKLEKNYFTEDFSEKYNECVITSDDK